MKDYELTLEERDAIWADKKRIKDRIHFEDALSHAAQKKLIEWQRGRCNHRFKLEDGKFYISPHRHSCPKCVQALLKDFDIEIR